MNGAVRFDLERGTVSLNNGEGCLLIPTQALSQLFRELGVHVIADLGNQLGNTMARAVRLDDAAQSTPEAVVEALGNQVALMGLGSLALETWGQAMVIAVRGGLNTGSGSGAITEDRGALFTSAVLQGLLARLNLPARVVPIDGEDAVCRYLVCNADAEELVLSWLDEGCTYGEVLARLNRTARVA